MRRRSFIQAMLAGSAAGLASAAEKQPGDRAYMAGLLQQMCEPVLTALAKGELVKKFRLELSPTWDGRDQRVAYLECFGRLMSGAAPWLALPEDGTPEGSTRARLRQLALQGFVHSADPGSPDCMLWKGTGQILVDSAYYTSALLRAPEALWAPLDATTKQRIVANIKALRSIDPPYTNWLLFAAMNEAWLMSIGEQVDPMRMNVAIRKINEWYVGDGWIKDGETFHFDYYGSFVMHPMLCQILEVLAKHKGPFWNGKPEQMRALAFKRMQRYSEHLERFVSPEGTFPMFGRSLTYRTAAFQPLALLALRKQLPASLPEGQVRAAMSAVHRRVWSAPSNFSKEGFLTIGFAGAQPELGDVYSNNGSMYIASESFLPLGLPATDSYWTAPAQDWTQKKAYAGAKFPKDYHVSY
ncbi:MAG: DUF2264 domain-containing protein [Telluria sp.]